MWDLCEAFRLICVLENLAYESLCLIVETILPGLRINEWSGAACIQSENFIKLSHKFRFPVRCQQLNQCVRVSVCACVWAPYSFAKARLRIWLKNRVVFLSYVKTLSWEYNIPLPTYYTECFKKSFTMTFQMFLCGECYYNVTLKGVQAMRDSTTSYIRVK
jgi:hypothetical protein